MLARRSRPLALALTTSLFVSAVAHAEPPVDPVDPHIGRDVAITAGAAAGALLLDLLPVRKHVAPWDHELFGALDHSVKDNYAPRAALMSDAGLALSIAVPAGFAIGTDWDRAAGERALVFGESIAATLAVGSLTKLIVARPRPYTYSTDPRAILKRRDAGRDAYRSFFSAHTAVAFASVAAGGALYATRTDDTGNRALVYGAGAFAAAATANWRIRAGRHFYSDVVAGALVGTAIGTAIPALQSRDLHVPTGIEWLAIASGLVAGAAGSQLVPVGQRRLATETEPRVHLGPMLVKGGAGLALGGSL